jgi:carbonic anhydrase/acetyltransferase-like protein (isoleucine patch superfamily)
MDSSLIDLRLMIRPHGGRAPRVAPSAYVDPSAQIIGDVEIGERSSVWCNATLRGDVHSIRIGEETNIQDNCVLHGERGQWPVLVGNRVTVGHAAVLHGCVIEDDALIGIGARVLNGARIGRGSIVAAGALVPEGMQVPPESVVMGVPAEVRRKVRPEERQRMLATNRNYVGYRQQYLDEQSGVFEIDPGGQGHA